MKETKKLNLGCFNDIKEGYVNLDKEKYFEGIDVIHDLEEFPYPFDDNTFEEILCKNTLSHLDVDRIKFYDELHRISKHNGVIIINEPYGINIFRSPEHKGMGFTFTTFEKLCQNSINYRTMLKFEIIKKSHKPTIISKYLIPIPKLRVFIARFLNDIIYNIIVELKVIKNEKRINT